MSKGPGRILVIDDDPDVLLAARLLLKTQFDLVRCETDPGQLPVLLGQSEWDVILLDMNFSPGNNSGGEGMSMLAQVLTHKPSAVVVMMTAYGDLDTAVEAIRKGASDFVLKPWQNEKMLATITSATRLSESRGEVSRLRSQQQEFVRSSWDGGPIIGQSAPMERIYRIVNKAAPTEANVLILGENGTGKELIARELHQRSDRSENIFMTVDLGAISETLFESELFGHVKGAFTDASRNRIGRLQAAAGGTLFLDEIANLPLYLQSKLLSVLELREVTPVGSERSAVVDVRIVCASNRDLRTMVAEGTFREDLLYRINTVEIELPPLRDRHEDIPKLLEHFADLYAKKYNQPRKRFSSAALNQLRNYAWPGNVRELRHAVERAIILSEDQVFRAGDFLSQPTKPSESAGDQSSRNLNLEEIEEQAIRTALGRHQGNVSRAARALGISRASLYRRMEKYGV